MNPYTFLSIGYDFLDKFWLGAKGINTRNIIEEIIPNDNIKILDMCCGTFLNGLPIARKKKNAKIIGLDRSKSMLKNAESKVRKYNLNNVELLCKDALNTELEESSFDFVIIGLVLHECKPEFRKGILDEAKRVLKDDGKIIILDWDIQEKLIRKIKFSILYIMELIANPKHFKEFYYSDKKEFFENYDLNMIKKYNCNYTALMVMNKIN